MTESIRLHLPDVIFVCETQQARGFMGTVCKKLHFGNKWEVRDPRGKKGGLLVAWRDTVRILRVWSSDFCIEIHVESVDSRIIL